MFVGQPAFTGCVTDIEAIVELLYPKCRSVLACFSGAQPAGRQRCLWLSLTVCLSICASMSLFLCVGQTVERGRGCLDKFARQSLSRNSDCMFLCLCGRSCPCGSVCISVSMCTSNSLCCLCFYVQTLTKGLISIKSPLAV